MIRLGMQLALDRSAQRRPKGVGRRGLQALLARADLAAAAGDAAGTRGDRSRQECDGRDSAAGRIERRFERATLDQDVSAADSLFDAQRLLDEKFAVHYG